MTPGDLSALIGAVSGITSLLTVVWMMAFRLSQISTRLDLLWKVYIEDSLIQQRRQGNLHHSSGFSNSQAWIESHKQQFSPEISRKLFSVAQKHKTLPSEECLAVDVLKILSWEGVLSRCRALEVPPSEYIVHAVAIIHEMHQALAAGPEAIAKLPYALEG